MHKGIGDHDLHQSTVNRTSSGECLGVLGKFSVDVSYGDQQATLPLLVVDGSGPSLGPGEDMSTIIRHLPVLCPFGTKLIGHTWTHFTTSDDIGPNMRAAWTSPLT